MEKIVRSVRALAATVLILLAGVTSVAAHPGHGGPLGHLHWFEALGVGVVLILTVGAAVFAKRWFGRNRRD